MVFANIVIAAIEAMCSPIRVREGAVQSFKD